MSTVLIERKPGHAAALAIVGIGVILTVVLAVIVAYPSSRFSPLVRIEGLVIAAQFGFLGMLLLKSAEQYSASYLIDDQGIQRRSWTRQTTLLWPDVVQVEEASVLAGPSLVPIRLAFLGRDGTRLTLVSSSVEEAERRMALLEPHVARFRREATRRLGEEGGIYHPRRSLGLALSLLIAPWFLMVGASAMFEPQSFSGLPPSWQTVWSLMGFLGLLLAAVGLDFLSRTLLVTHDGLHLKSYFFDRKISFDAIESLTRFHSKRGENDPPARESTIFQDNRGQSIEIDSSMPAYQAIGEFVRSRMKSSKEKGKPLEAEWS